MFGLQINMALLTAVTVLLLLAAAPVCAADPSPAPSPILIDPLDPRAGEGASAVGAPLLAMLVVVGVGVVAAVAGLAYARVTARR